MENKQQKLVAALKDGSVIDHIPSDKLFTVVQLLGLDKYKEPVLIGNNLESKVMNRKGLIKISDKFLTEDEISKLAAICPKIRLTVIRNFEVVDKHDITLPDTLTDIVKCQNPVCITNNEPMKTVFYVKREDSTGSLFPHNFDVFDDSDPILKCRYCGKEVHLKDIKLK